jgi:hypothetical protein
MRRLICSGQVPEQHGLIKSHCSRQSAIELSSESDFPCFRKNQIRFNCSSDIVSALGSSFHIWSGGFLLSSPIALITHALTFEEFFGLKCLRDLEILNGNCGLVFTEVFLCLHLLFTDSRQINRRPESREF